MQRMRNVLGRILFSKKRRGSLLAPHSDEELLTPESQSRDAKAAEIRSTDGACFERMDFDGADEFVHLLQLALEYDAPIFTLEDTTAALLRRYGHRLHPGEIRGILYHSTFLDKSGRYISSATVERAVTAVHPTVAVCHSWSQQQNAAYVCTMMEQDFTVIGHVSPAVLTRQHQAFTIAVAHPFALGWMIDPAKPIIRQELLGRDPRSVPSVDMDSIGFNTVDMGNIHPMGLLEALRIWLEAPGCVRRLDDSLRAAFERDRETLSTPSEESLALFTDFARLHVDPRVVRAVIDHIWADTSFIPGGSATLKGMICVSPNLRALSISPGILQRIVGNAVRACTHVKACVEALELEEAQRTARNINLTGMSPKSEVELVRGAPTGATLLFVPSRARFLSSHEGKVLLNGVSTNFVWRNDFLSVYTSTKPRDPATEHLAINALHHPQSPSKLHLNILGMFLSPETERMLPRQHGSPMSRADHEWLAMLTTGMPEFGRIILDAMVKSNAAQQISPDDARGGITPGYVLLNGTADDPYATRGGRCDTAEELAATLAEERFDRLYTFRGATHARFMGIVATTISYPDFEPEMRESEWWSPMLHEMMCRLQDEHNELASTRHHRELAAVMRAWANRIEFTFVQEPTYVPLFPGRNPVAYPAKTARIIREMLCATHHVLKEHYERKADPIRAATNKPPRGSLIFCMILADCYRFAQDFPLEPEQKVTWTRVRELQSSQLAPTGGPTFWGQFLSDVADRVNDPAHTRLYMPSVQTRQGFPHTAWTSMRDVRTRK